MVSNTDCFQEENRVYLLHLCSGGRGNWARVIVDKVDSAMNIVGRQKIIETGLRTTRKVISSR